jgi:hypothetical protein
MSAAYWEERFRSWATPPGDTEKDRIENAVSAIRKAMDADDKLAEITKVYPQGSYRNRVNVKQESDVDVGVLYTGGGFLPDYPTGYTGEHFGNSDHGYSYSQFKENVQAALWNYFGKAAVHRGNKAFDIHPNAYRVDADAVPVMAHRRYAADGTYVTGVQLFPDSGPKVINWPEALLDGWPNQHYEQGVAKNVATQRAFKGAVRILKKLRVIMEEAGNPAAKDVPGFFIECLAYNVPNSAFMYPTWDETITRVISQIRYSTGDAARCVDWEEVSGWKWLFRGSPDSKRAMAYNFIDKAWNHIGVRKYW